MIGQIKVILLLVAAVSNAAVLPTGGKTETVVPEIVSSTPAPVDAKSVTTTSVPSSTSAASPSNSTETATSTSSPATEATTLSVAQTTTVTAPKITTSTDKQNEGKSSDKTKDEASKGTSNTPAEHKKEAQSPKLEEKPTVSTHTPSIFGQHDFSGVNDFDIEDDDDDDDDDDNEDDDDLFPHELFAY